MLHFVEQCARHSCDATTMKTRSLGIISALWVTLLSPAVALAQDSVPWQDGLSGAPRILAVPILKPSKEALITIQDSPGRDRSDLTLSVNGKTYRPNQFGQVIFDVPNAGAVILSLMENGKEVARKDYALLPGGLLAETDAAPTLAKVFAIQEPPRGGSSLIYSPAVVQPGDTICLLGHNLDSAGVRGEKIVIDGANADTVSASPLAVLAVLPKSLSLGPLKSIFAVSKNGESTNQYEVDVARADISLSDESASTGTIPVNVRIKGTNFPALVEVTNEHPEAISLTAPDKKILSDTALVVLPGGEQNSLSLSGNLKDKALVSLKARILPDVPEFVGGKSVSVTDGSIKSTINYAELVRIKRRLLGVETKLLEMRQARGISTPPERQLAELHALGVRREALVEMLATRVAVFTANGGTPEIVNQAIDDAANGAYYVLESAVRDMTVVPRSSAFALATSLNRQVRTVRPPLPDVVIRLLLPLELDPNAAAILQRVRHVDVAPVASTPEHFAPAPVPATPVVKKKKVVAPAKATRVSRKKVAAKTSVRRRTSVRIQSSSRRTSRRRSRR